MIYLDSSVVLARLLAEPHSTSNAMWNDTLVSSRLLEYEVWNRIHARRLARTLGETVHTLIDHIELVALTPAVLARAMEPFPIAVRTLDGLHLATIEYMRGDGHAVELASLDGRLLAAARALGIAVYQP